MSESTFWLFSTLFWTLVLSFYSMQEMACISCNKLRLDYAVSRKERWALWLHELLETPTLLFSTTLIGVNMAMMISSESSRRLFESWGYDPNLAPLAEIPLLVIIGELVPMFAARLYAEHACRLGVPLLYASAKLFSPIVAIVNYFFRKKEKKPTAPFLSRDELQKLLEEHQGGYLGEQATPVNDIIGNIFSLRHMTAAQLMQRLDQVTCASTHTTVGELREMMKKSPQPFFPVYHRSRTKIVGLIYPQDILSASSNKRIDEFTESTYFVMQETPALELIHKLQEESADAAIVISARGDARGIIFLEDLIDELFGSEPKTAPTDLRYLEKTVSADMSIAEFNETYDANIDPHGCKTFAELVEKLLGRAPHPGDTLLVEPFELIVKETSLFKAKTVQIRSKAP